jgi:CRP/FNR family transcriptional regulator
MSSRDKVLDHIRIDTSVHELLLKGRRYSLNRQQIIQSTEDREVINIIISGFFRKYMINNDGTIGAIIVYGPGDIFPITLMYKKMFSQPLYTGQETYFYEAMSKAEVSTMDAEQLAQMIKQDARLYTSFIQEVGRHLEFCINSIENLMLRNSNKRISHMLIYFAKKFGVKTPDGLKINLPLTHQNIGEVLNITRETVSTNLKDLRMRGLIKIDNSTRALIVPSIEKLQAEAYE